VVNLIDRKVTYLRARRKVLKGMCHLRGNTVADERGPVLWVVDMGCGPDCRAISKRANFGKADPFYRNPATLHGRKGAFN